MSYEELFQILKGMSKEERESFDVSIYDANDDEYFPITGHFVVDETDVLDEGTFVLEIKGKDA